MYDFFGDDMRTFYIFKINKEFKIIARNKPYNLFLALDNIHNMDEANITLACKLFDEICDKPNMRDLNMSLFNELRSSDYYTKFNNNHLINNYYTEENSKLIVKKTFMKVKSSMNNPTFFQILKKTPNLFVVDFASKDYFWLS